MSAHPVFIIISVFCVAAARESKIDPIIIRGHHLHSCPTAEERLNAQQLITTEVRNILLDVRTVPQCGSGLWHRVAHLNMSDTSQHCPPSWSEYNSNGVRACGRPTTSTGTCPAEFYSAQNQYSHVCGRIIGYQVGSPAAFWPGRSLGNENFLDSIYVDGVSITHGMPRTHIWTYAAGTSAVPSTEAIANCPCLYDTNNADVIHPPSVIQSSYYCESGNAGNSTGPLYSSDPLWDGKQCEGRCCSDGLSPPWFSMTLPAPTTDDLEVRICADQDTQDEDNPISLLELYVQ